MLVLKHMARELDVDPYRLRKVLRARFGLRRSWRWSERTRDYDRCLTHARKVMKNGKS